LNGQGINANTDSFELEESSLEEDITGEEKDNISDLIDIFIHKALDIEDCAKEFVTLAQTNHKSNAQRLKSDLENTTDLFNGEQKKPEVIVGIKKIRKTIKEINRHNRSDIATTLEKSLFINLFSIFDKYIGDLISILYNKKPELFNSINREISLSEALQYSSLEELRNVVLDKEIESIRRKSYIEQFKEMENIFSITLTKFDQWPNFIENAQRRNLFTHCDGIVSDQYLSVCKSVGYKEKKVYNYGDQLGIGSDYFFQACQRITEVAVMLGHTLWRKVLPDELETADDHLHTLIFDFLEMEHWNNAVSLSEFCLSLPKVSSEKIDRINTINYSIALKALGKDGTAKKILEQKDWSATSFDFSLAYFVLVENYIDAQKFMVKIGKSGDLIEEISYHDWPLFREFRNTEEFFKGYEEVYGYKYIEKLSAIAEEKKDELLDTDLL